MDDSQKHLIYYNICLISFCVQKPFPRWMFSVHFLNISSFFNLKLETNTGTNESRKGGKEEKGNEAHIK